MAQYIFFVNKQTKTCLQGVWHLPDNLDAFPSQAQKRTKLPERRYGWVTQLESGNVWPSNCMFLLSADDKNILSLLLFWHHLGTLNSIVKSRMNSDFDQRMKDSLWLPPPPAVRKIVRTVGGFRHSPYVVPHFPSSSTIPPPLSPWPSVRGSSGGLVIPPPPLPGIKFHLTLSLSRGAAGAEG